MVFYLYHCVRYTFAIYSQLYSYIQRRFLWHKRQSWVCTDDMIRPRFIYGIFHTWSYRGQRVPLAAWTGINFVVSWDRAVNAWNQCESLHRTAHVLILQLKGWIPYILGLMYVNLNLKPIAIIMVILYASSHGSDLRSTSHIFPVNDHNDIDQNWDYISFLMFIGIKELL